MKSRWIGLGTLAIGLLLFAHEGHKAATIKGVKWEKGKLSMEEANKKAIGLTHAVVDFRTIEELLTVNAVAQVPWSARAYAGTRVSGEIASVHVRPGAAVKAGDVLAEIRSVELENLNAEARQREIDLATAKENLALAEKAGPSIVPELELLPLRVAVEERRNALEASRLQLETVGSPQVRATIDGWLLHVDLSPGRWVEPADHLFEILDLREIWLEAEVPETRSSRVQPGQKARITLAAFPDRALEGVVRRKQDEIDPERYAERVWISLPNPDGRIRPGMYGRVDIVLDRAVDIFAAPSAAIVTQGAERYALVQNKDGSYRKAGVVLGRTDGAFVEIIEGLYPGDRIVLQGSHELSEVFVQGHAELSRDARRAIGAEFVDVEERPVDEVIELPGRVKLPPDGKASAATRLEGRIEKILVSVGQRVEAGQPVVQIHSLEMERAEMELLRERLRIDLLRDQLAGLEQLQARNIAPRKELIRVQSDLRSQESVVQNLRSRLQALGLSSAQIAGLEKDRRLIRALEIPAPLAGTVTEIDVAIGQVVKPGDHFVEIQNRTRLLVEGYAFERDLARIRPGADIEVRLRGAWHKSKIAGMGTALGDRVLQVWAEVEGVDVVPGTQATLSLVTAKGSRDVIAAPRAALLEDGGKTWVFVERKDRIHRFPVVVGRRDSHYAHIVKGLFPMDRVAVKGLDELNNAVSAVR